MKTSKPGDTPDSGVGGDRRAHPREIIACPARVHLDPEDPEAPVLDCAVDNLSVHGARVVTAKHWFPPHQSCVLEFAEPGWRIQPCRAVGVVRWAAQDDPDVSVFGIEFNPPLASVEAPAKPPR